MFFVLLFPKFVLLTVVFCHTVSFLYTNQLSLLRANQKNTLRAVQSPDPLFFVFREAIESFFCGEIFFSLESGPFRLERRVFSRAKYAYFLYEEFIPQKKYNFLSDFPNQLGVI